MFQTKQFNDWTTYWIRCFWSPYFKILELIRPHSCSRIETKAESQNRIPLVSSICLDYKQPADGQQEKDVRCHLCTTPRWAIYYPSFKYFQFNVLTRSKNYSNRLYQRNIYSFPDCPFLSEYVKNEINLEVVFLSTLVLSQTGKWK